ncbi:hypothetical protein OHS33_03575 [Streptomyces sp. NBC_00536]|uniref:hypothetical protein n=1 Tax=Streptomyces sp. NBC_00536 TaxID=2975769 RepID=UPI002E8244BA|nr:hypothetical protein [Streptomyces sp. NBC_00536]WUC77510.1 hypothetical protein OHS33_03575 [Streptomyces sp. NBC_00536]
MNEELAERLRAAAEAHQPDRARILARVERGMSGAPARHRERSGVRPWPRVALASLTAVGTLAVGGFAVAAIVQSPPARPEVSATPAAPSAPSRPPGPTPATPPTPSAPATGRPTTPDRSSPPGPSPSAPSPADSAPPGSAHVQDGPLSSAGALGANSNGFWAQSNVTLTSTEPLSALTVELRIAQTGAVQSTGNWRTLPAEDFTVTVQNEGGAVVYRWILKPGRTVPAGQHVFAGQYNHATGAREAGHDGYRVDAGGPRGALSVWGGFTPPR